MIARPGHSRYISILQISAHIFGPAWDYFPAFMLRCSLPVCWWFERSLTIGLRESARVRVLDCSAIITKECGNIGKHKEFGIGWPDLYISII